MWFPGVNFGSSLHLLFNLYISFPFNAAIAELLDNAVDEVYFSLCNDQCLLNFNYSINERLFVAEKTQNFLTLKGKFDFYLMEFCGSTSRML